MKKINLLLTFLFYTLVSHAQNTGSTCFNPLPLIPGLTTSFLLPPAGNALISAPNNNYGCLISPNDSIQTESPFWQYIKVDSAGLIDLEIIYSVTGFSYILYGPFNDYNDMLGSCGMLGSPSAPIVDCMTNASDLNVVLNPTQPGQHYLILVTNSYGWNTLISLNVDSSSTGSLDTTLQKHFHNLSGKVFYDQNLNGIKDANEYSINSPLSQVNISPISNFGNTTYTQVNLSNDFHYHHYSNTAVNYTIDHPIPPIFSHSTASTFMVTLDSVNNHSDTLDFGIYPNTTAASANLQHVNPWTAMHCIYGGQLFVEIQNTGTSEFTTTNMRLELDTNANFNMAYYIKNLVSSSLLADSIVDNNVYFTLDNLNLFQTQFVGYKLLLDTTVVANDTLTFVAHYSGTDGSGITTIVSDTSNVVVSCSYDPNNKLVFPNGKQGPAEVLPTDALTYVVNFQNTGNAEAVNVRISDSISSHLDLSTLSVLGKSHDMHYLINQNSNVVTFYFNGIHLPDSSNSPIGSKGFVKFKIKPYPALVPHTEIVNNANIYFDYNAPILTNNTFNIIDCYNTPNPNINHVNGFLQVLDNNDYTYQWYFNDTLIVGENSAELLVDKNGIYTVIIIDQYNCEATATYQIDYLSLPANEKDEMFIFPNPFNDLIEVVATDQSHLEIVVMDELGKIIIEFSPIDVQNYLIDTQMLSKGMYFIKITDQLGNSIIKKMVKN
ncbi:T9SS type A sorting domain-containing protein [Putridiphycobacter roseus]|nr:T9SS type A sorting domain-containing protein [Putridiphycobacter roseus]